jgi:hypothetical protein
MSLGRCAAVAIPLNTLQCVLHKCDVEELQATLAGKGLLTSAEKHAGQKDRQ